MSQSRLEQLSHDEEQVILRQLKPLVIRYGEANRGVIEAVIAMSVDDKWEAIHRVIRDFEVWVRAGELDPLINPLSRRLFNDFCWTYWARNTFPLLDNNKTEEE